MRKYLPRVILYPNREKDREILAWLEKMPKGVKTQTIKDAIWASIKGYDLAPSHPPRHAKSPPPQYSATPLPNGTMSGSLTFDTRELLADIRQIVEAGVAQGLAHHGGQLGQEMPENGDEIEALLGDLDMSFMLDDDE